ncbi:MAG: hypothetical protein WDW38_008588 [Sanguina aurantia]
MAIAQEPVTRHCHDCNRTGTPQWREGPDGPKTLCNACGVKRQRLRRGPRPAAAAAAVLDAPRLPSQRLARFKRRASESSGDEQGRVSVQEDTGNEDEGEESDQDMAVLNLLCFASSSDVPLKRRRGAGPRVQGLAAKELLQAAASGGPMPTNINPLHAALAQCIGLPHGMLSDPEVDLLHQMHLNFQVRRSHPPPTHPSRELGRTLSTPSRCLHAITARITRLRAGGAMGVDTIRAATPLSCTAASRAQRTTCWVSTPPPMGPTTSCQSHWTRNRGVHSTDPDPVGQHRACNADPDPVGQHRACNADPDPGAWVALSLANTAQAAAEDALRGAEQGTESAREAVALISMQLSRRLGAFAQRADAAKAAAALIVPPAAADNF